MVKTLDETIGFSTKLGLRQSIEKGLANTAKGNITPLMNDYVTQTLNSLYEVTSNTPTIKREVA